MSHVPAPADTDMRQTAVLDKVIHKIVDHGPGISYKTYVVGRLKL